MAHNLEIIGGQASFFTTKEPAWHGLGTVVKEAQTQEEVLKLAKLDYDVCMYKPYMPHPDGLLRADGLPLKQVKGDFHGLYRCDTGSVFGFVSGKYNVIQNREAFSFFDSFIDRSEAIYHTAGVLLDGRTAWILAKLPEHIIVHGEQIDMYVLAVMHHDGKHAMMLMITPVKVVCNNTLNAAIKGAQNIVKVRHTATYSEQIDEAVRIMGIKNEYVSEIAAAFDQMAETKVTDATAKAYFNTLIVGKHDAQAVSPQKQRMLDEVIRYYLHHPTQQECVGNAFGLYNAVTGYFQNAKEYRNDEQRFNNILLGASDSKITAKAFQLALSI